MPYTVRFKKSARKELESLERETRKKVLSFIEALALNPTPANSLKLTSIPLWRIRVGSFRILYEIQNEVLLVYVVKIAHRKDVYRHL
jgi:mRNA interferase RelE/StbE